jgi:hypothetical protein
MVLKNQMRSKQTKENGTMNQPTKRALIFALAMMVLLAACAPAAPTQDPALVQQVIEQAVELTVAAQNAEATAQQALIVPSNTPLPTQTEVLPPSPTPLVPTATPFVIVPATNTVAASSGGGGGGTVVRPQYACEATSRRPFDNTIFKPNDEFDIRWTIVNTGTRTLRAGLDLEYLSGPEMTGAVKFVELPELEPGESYEVIFDAVAPNQQGFHVMTWRVEGPLCFPYTAINVERP